MKQKGCLALVLLGITGWAALLLFTSDQEIQLAGPYWLHYDHEGREGAIVSYHHPEWGAYGALPVEVDSIFVSEHHVFASTRWWHYILEVPISEPMSITPADYLLFSAPDRAAFDAVADSLGARVSFESVDR